MAGPVIIRGVNKMKGRIKSLNISDKKGVAKKPVPKFTLKENWGVEGDVHAGPGNRQVSLLAWESIQKQKECPKADAKRDDFDLEPGDFAENITTEGLDLTKVKLGDRIKIGDVEMRVSKIGKECHTYCQIYKRFGDCIMPREGIFAQVIKGGDVSVDDEVEVICED